MIKAEIIADSISPTGNRLTSFVLRFPRPLLAEFNTHRAFSRNSASSRAIPFAKMLEMVKTDPFIPLRFQKDHSGMQGAEYYEGEEHEQCVRDWLAARDAAVSAATSFKLPITKQLRNRLLEPFMWHTVIVTATDYENWFALRAHKDAEIHIERLAYVMLEAYNASTPKLLQPGEWHVPFGDRFEDNRLMLAVSNHEGDTVWEGDAMTEALAAGRRKVSIARCARISYVNFEGKDDYVADLRVCEKLFGSTPRHLSPTEHVAQCRADNQQVGNFRGWTQFRHTFADQNLRDPRVAAKTPSTT